MSLQSGREEAVRLATEKLQSVDFVSRCADVGLPPPGNEGVAFRAFGSDLLFRLPSFELIRLESGETAKLSEQVLVMHYLLHRGPLIKTEENISFRGYPEGQFYWGPFQARTTVPLLRRIGNDLELLKKNLNRFDWKESEIGDFGAKIHLIGKLDLLLAYYLGDEEFPPTADVLFDACIRQVYVAEDAAVLASLVCIGLL